MLHPVKVYDPSGKLKKIISQKILNRRSDEICLNPTLFSKQTKGRKKGPTNLEEIISTRKGQTLTTAPYSFPLAH